PHTSPPTAPAATPPSPLSLHDALPISGLGGRGRGERPREPPTGRGGEAVQGSKRIADHVSIVHPTTDNGPEPGPQPCGPGVAEKDRKSTRLNSSHVKISYAVFCLKKKK